MDMSSFYPSSIIAMNIDASTLLFKVILDPNQFDVCGGKLRFRGITDYSPIGANTAFDYHDLSKEVFDNMQTGNVVNTMTKWFNLPTIEADDKVLAVDAPSNPLEDVIAYDTEDGTLIEQIIVTNNTADKSQPGKYEVTYQVTDVKGAFTAKTKMDSDTTTIEKDRTDTKKYDVKTNKQKNMVMRIIILAAVITTVFLVLERRNQNNKIARTITCTSFVYISRCFDFKRKLEYSRRAE